MNQKINNTAKLAFQKGFILANIDRSSRWISTKLNTTDFPLGKSAVYDH
jgi:hypothetical protein